MNTIQKISLVVTFLILNQISVQGQNTTRSPFSSYGIGNIESSGYAFNSSMGDAKFGIADPYQINISNPASYSSLRLPTFNVGINYNFLQINQGSDSQSGNIGYLKNISLAFPIAKWWGMSFGMVPQSRMGYRFTTTSTVTDFGNVNYLYEGEGGINRAYFGNGFNFINDTTQTLSVGFNASYIFGNLDRQKRVEPQDVDGAFSTFYSDQTKVGDFNFDFGLLYKRKFSNNLTASLGAFYSLGDSARTRTNEYAYNYRANEFNKIDIIEDTIFSRLDTGYLYIPQTIGIGFTVQLNRRQDKYNKQYMLAVDYSSTDWSKSSLLGQNLGLAKRDQLSVGFQYIPDAKSYKNVQKMINYRFGVRYTNTHLIVDNQNIAEYGMSFGVGVPIISAGQGTMFNIGVEAGRRGSKSVNPVYEQFTTIHIGLSLTPSKFDRWFYKSKID
ncbi:MAG: hypothetical protein JKY42_10860 [Flavobacteriales bacterium]|nr:hypothetical protein [Flavobacteriales bacterium]